MLDAWLRDGQHSPHVDSEHLQPPHTVLQRLAALEWKRLACPQQQHPDAGPVMGVVLHAGARTSWRFARPCTRSRVSHRMLATAYANLGVACPLPPIFMLRAVASCLGICLGLFLALCVAQVHAASAFFDTSDFYMNHAWAQWVVMLGMRHTLFRAAAWMYKSAVLANHWQGGGGETKED
jgi:hypothetical protein